MSVNDANRRYLEKVVHKRFGKPPQTARHLRRRAAKLLKQSNKRKGTENAEIQS